jgi:hypothetical protein
MGGVFPSDDDTGEGANFHRNSSLTLRATTIYVDTRSDLAEGAREIPRWGQVMGVMLENAAGLATCVSDATISSEPSSSSD